MRENVEVDDTVEHELSGSKGTAHFAMKFDKGSKLLHAINAAY